MTLRIYLTYCEMAVVDDVFACVDASVDGHGIRCTLNSSSHNVEGVVRLAIEIEQETDGRFVAEIAALPGVLAHAENHDEVLAAVQALALRVLADRLENGEPVPEVEHLFAVDA